MDDTKQQPETVKNVCMTETSRRKCLLLMSACLILMMAGQCVSGPIFANFIKFSYGLNQRQLDFSVALLYLGTVLIFLSGLFYDRFGTRASVVFSGVLSTLSMTFVAVAMAYPEPLRQNLWLLFILLFLYGHSFNYSYVAAIGCCMKSFSSSQRVFVMTLADNFFSLGPPVVAFIYYVVFDNMHRSNTDQRPVGTRIVLLVLNATIHVFAFIFLTPFDDSLDKEKPSESSPILDKQPPEQDRQKLQDAFNSNMNETHTATAETIDTRPQDGFLTQTQYFFTVCCSDRFMPLMLGVALSIGANLTTFLNLTSVTRSLSLTQYDVYYFWFPTLVGIAWRCLIGLLTDRHLPKASHRSAVLLASVVCFGAPSTLLLSVPLLPGVSAFGITITAYVFDSINNATLFTIPPVIISMTEKPHLFGRLYSSCLLLASTTGLLLILQFGALYDAQIRTTSGDKTGGVAFNSTAPGTAASIPECFGYVCYMYGGVASTVCQLVSIVCFSYYTISLRRANL